MNHFENEVKKAKLALDIAKIRLELYVFGCTFLYENQAENLANECLFHCNTQYRATEKTFEMTVDEITFVNERLDKIDSLNSKMYAYEK